MLLANLTAVPENGAVSQVRVSARVWRRLVEGVDRGCDLLYEPAIDKLVDLEPAPAVGTLLPLLGQPLLDAVPAA